MDMVNVMSHNINAAPAKVENNFFVQSSVSVEQAKKAENNSILVEPVVNVELDKKLAAQKKELVENTHKEESSEAEVKEAMDVVSSFINSTLKQVTFSYDTTAGKMVITMIDKETQEVINQFPSDKIISMAGRIKELQQEVESISGLLVDKHV